MGARSWRFVADIGGTHARFAVAAATGEAIELRRDLRLADYPDLPTALREWIAFVGDHGAWAQGPSQACIAIASPQPEALRVHMLNAPWVLDRRECSVILGHPELHVLNDFEVLGYALDSPPAQKGDDILYAPGTAGTPRLVIGPGTGLGTCAVLGAGASTHVIAAEGGHADLPIGNETEWEIHQSLSRRYDHVSAERVLSGAGLVALYRFFAAEAIVGSDASEAITPDAITLDSITLDAITPEAITAAAQTGSDPVALRAVDQLCAYLGAVAGNAVLTLGARGGVFLVGEILAACAERLSSGAFVERFTGKGRYRAYLEAVPVRRLSGEGLALYGAMRFLNLRCTLPD